MRLKALLRSSGIGYLLGLTLFTQLAQGAQCEHEGVLLHDHFEAGALASCDSGSDGKFAISVRPENIPINPSPWYAFELQANKEKSVSVELTYAHGKHRYHPLISHDRVHWNRLAESAIEVSDDGKRLHMDVPAKAGKQWIAAQPVITNQDHRSWITSVADSHSQTRVIPFARSVQGRVLTALLAEHVPQGEFVLILGRAHPPEVNGALSLQAFVQELLSDSAQAKAFRAHYNLLVLPNINPDGVANGHWRHNANGADLNRDWGVFEQPETRAAMALINQTIQPQKLALVLDFHATKRTVFYSQPATLPSSNPDLANQWVATINTRSEDMEFAIKPGHSPEKTTAKTFFYMAYGVPAITYEMSESASMKEVEEAAIISAGAFMDVLAGTE